jgi:hypothetical protein
MTSKQKSVERKRKDISTSSKENETVAFQVRLDVDLHEQMKKAAEKADISLNQLIQGICRGAMAHLVQGEPEIDDGGYVSQKQQRGCVFFGRVGFIPEELKDKIESDYSTSGIYPNSVDKGAVWFGLDFTNRGYVRYQPR